MDLTCCTFRLNMPGLSGKNMPNTEPRFSTQPGIVDFTDTKTAFAHKSNKELIFTAWLFRFMNKPWMVQTGSTFGMWLNKSGLTIFNPVIRWTIFKQFCGGTSLGDSQK